MTTVQEVMTELKSKGSEQTCKIYRNHGAEGDMYGVKIADLKVILKRIRNDQQLALDLWDTNNSDAMYLAGLAADGKQMTKKQLEQWAKTAWWYMLSEHSVAGVAAENPKALELAKKWMKSKKENVATAGWATYSAALSTWADDDLDLDEIEQLVQQVESTIHESPNRVRYCMNQFLICVGTYVKPLLKRAKQAAKSIGKVDVQMGKTSCKVPLATEYIAKIEKMGRVGQKRKTAKC